MKCGSGNYGNMLQQRCPCNNMRGEVDVIIDTLLHRVAAGAEDPEV
jgi:hypothetical protein